MLTLPVCGYAKGQSGHTPVGASPPTAVADAEVRTVSSAATSNAIRCPSAIAITSVDLPFPFTRIDAPPLVLVVYSRHKRCLYSCRTTQKTTKRNTPLLGQGRPEGTNLPLPSLFAAMLTLRLPAENSVVFWDQAPICVMDLRKSEYANEARPERLGSRYTDPCLALPEATSGRKLVPRAARWRSKRICVKEESIYH